MLETLTLDTRPGDPEVDALLDHLHIHCPRLQALELFGWAIGTTPDLRDGEHSACCPLGILQLFFTLYDSPPTHALIQGHMHRHMIGKIWVSHRWVKYHVVTRCLAVCPFIQGTFLTA
jgi:hypothetical protein